MKIYYDALKELSLLENEKGALDNQLKSKKKIIDKDFGNKISQLKDQIYNLERECDKALKDEDTKLEAVIAELNIKHNKAFEIQTQTEKTFTLIDVYLDDPCLTETALPLVNDQYKHIGVELNSERRSPKNKYSLTLTYNSIFKHRFDKIFYRRNEQLKKAPTIEELKVWFEKNKTKLVSQDFLQAHAQYEVEYEKAKELYKTKEWKLAYWLHKKDYYENQVSTGTSTEAYKGILEILTILKTPRKNLTLLLADIVTDQGKKELFERIKDENN